MPEFYREYKRNRLDLFAWLKKGHFGKLLIYKDMSWPTVPVRLLFEKRVKKDETMKVNTGEDRWVSPDVEKR